MHPPGELERFHSAERVTVAPTIVHVGTTAEERQAIARRLELVELPALEADCVLDRPDDGETVRVRGHLRAKVVQSCVVTLDPLDAEVDLTFERLLVPGWVPSMQEGEESVDAEAPDIEALEGDRIDLGEMIVEELSLGLDPYPRAPGAEVVDDGAEPGDHPFAALERLRRP